MTYHINVKKTNVKEFLQIIQSLRSLGVIESYNSSRDLVTEGDPIDDQTLLNVLDNSREEIKNDKHFTMEEVRDQIKSWKKK